MPSNCWRKQMRGKIFGSSSRRLRTPDPRDEGIVRRLQENDGRSTQAVHRAAEAHGRASRTWRGAGPRSRMCSKT
jgi:hypothetical protein